jgi:hypothetical protein
MADGTFTISGVAPGRYRLNTPLAMIPIPMMSGLSGGWTLKSVMPTAATSLTRRST